MKRYDWLADAAAQGVRLDRAIQQNLPQIPWPVLQEAFKRRDVKVNGRRLKPDYRLSPGDTVQVYCPEQAEAPLDIVYEDADVLLLNKRAGISVTPDEGGGLSLTEVVRRSVPGASPCHRLDHQTCGLLLFAKTDAALNVLEEVFRRRTAEKYYECLVRGLPKPPSAVCTAWLLKDADAGRVRILDRPADGAQRIQTGYETLQSGPVSRLRVRLFTGRTHQIRAHLASLGHPLLGDDLYGDHGFNRSQRARRLMLCACELTLHTGGALPQLDGKTFRVSPPF